MKKFSAFVLLSAILATASIFSCKSSAKQDEKTEIKVASISVKPTSITLKKGETSTLKATILPSNAPQEVKWESDAPAKVSVDKNGVISTKDIGKANIKAISLKDATKTATCVVTVNEAGVAVEKVEVKPSSITLKKGETSTLTATITPSNASQEVKWESDKPEIATVDGSGKITAKELGSANIKATSLKDCTKSATCVVTVNATDVAIEKVEVKPSSITLKKGETSTLTASITPSNASQEVKWESDAPDKVSVEEIENGKVKITAKDIGTANIKATSLKDGTKSAICVVTVDKAGIEIISVEVKPSSIKLKKGDTSTLEAKINPINAPQEVKWESDAPDKVSVDDKGKITAKAYGTAKIKATSLKDGTKSATCEAIVEAPVEKLKLDKTKLELKFGESYKLTATIEPAEAPQEVIWSCDVEGVATCSAEGLITAGSKEGMVTITATSKTDPSKKDSCTVYVAEKKIESLKLDKDEIEMEIDATEHFNVNIQPSGASYWMDYKVEAGSAVKVVSHWRPSMSYNRVEVKSGSEEKTQKITFWSVVNPDIKTTLTIKTYRPKVKAITVANKEIKFTDKNEKMVATVLPAKAVKDVKWESKNIEVAAIDSSTGRIVPIKPGKATIVATSTDGSNVKGEATLTVKAPEIGVGLKDSPIYYGSKPATLTIEPKVGGLYYNFEVTSNNPDLEVYKKDSGNDRIFEIKVKNQRARTTTTYLKVMSKAFPDATTEVGVSVKTIIPKSISIEADDKMYLSEELPLSISATKEENSQWHPTPNKDVRWEWDNSYSTSGIGASDFEIKQDGKVRLRNPSTNHVGKTFRIKATSQLDSSIVATKVIKLYLNMAKVPELLVDNSGLIEINKVLPGECTMCDDEDYDLYNTNPLGKEYYVIFKNELDDKDYNKFVVSEEKAPNDIPNPYYFYRTLYETEKKDGFEKPIIKLKEPKNHTSSKHVKFYVWPIDPKTEKPFTKGTGNDFDFRIWAKPTGIEIAQCNFNFKDFNHEKHGKGYQSEEFGGNDSEKWKYTKVRVMPQHANPNLLVWDSEGEGYADKAIIPGTLTKADSVDEDGCWRFNFQLNNRKNAWKHRTNILFGLSASGRYTGNEKIKTYMQIILSSAL